MILVDGITSYETKLRHKAWSHMVSTVGPDELHAIAARIGLKRSWFQAGASFEHYDVTPTKRVLAIKLGALEVDARILLFANYDYAIKRPGERVPERWAAEIAALHSERVLRGDLGTPNATEYRREDPKEID